MTWYAAHFLSGFELKGARRAADSRLGRAFCPLRRREWVDRGKKRSVLKPFMPGYAFVESAALATYVHRYHEVAAAPGFLGFVGGGLRPQVVRPDQVEPMLATALEVARSRAWDALRLSSELSIANVNETVALNINIDS